jgi:nucleotide-binding universal stress UspA family protein
MYDDILLPTDGSDGMTTIIDHAVSLAEVHDATLHALYVANTASLTDLPMESSWEGVSQALRTEGEHAIAQVDEHVGDVPLETTIIDGSPAKEIITYADENECDIIVMGTHGRSGVDRLLLGSVAERVVRSAEPPVLTIRVNDSDS